MIKALLAGAAAAGALVLAAGTPTAALAANIVVNPSPCTLVQDGAPCFFDPGQITTTNLDDVSAAYNAQTDPDIDLGSFSFVQSIDGNGSDLSGHIDADFLVEYYGVKTTNAFALYWITPTDSLDWTTAGIGGGGHGLSHIVLIGNDDNTPGGGNVPEPATWAMMIMGFGGVGALMRRRRELTVA